MNRDIKLKFSEVFLIVFKSLKISFTIKSKFSIFISIIGFIMSLVPILISVVLKNFSNKIVALDKGLENTLYPTIVLFLILLSLYILQAVYNFVSYYNLAKDSLRTQRYLKEAVIKCSCNVKYKYIENFDNFKEKIAFVDEAGYRVANSIQSIIVLIQHLISFIGIIYVLIMVNFWIVILLLVTSIPAVILSSMQKDELYRSKIKWMKEGAFVIHYYFLCVSENAINLVRHFRLLNYLKKKWQDISKIYISKKNTMTKKHVIINSASDFLRNIVYIGVLLIVSYQIYNNPVLGIGVFMLVISLSHQLQNLTYSILIGVSQFYNDINYMKDFFYLESLDYETIHENTYIYEKTDINFENVSFKYPNSKNNALENINVKIYDGEKVAIVGENGSGKTTFINLLCGFYSPDKGVVKINNLNIHDNLLATRRSISAVFQDFGRYETSLKNNIIVSDKFKRTDDDDIFELLKKTDMYDYVKNLPGSLNEEIGTFHKSGNNLSGGQWQKVALARALYRDQAKIMVLDEPTAALDPIAETNLYQNFSNLTQNKTTILISHRLGITKLVDRILVFKDGKIIEDGNHGELMRKKGYYSELYNAQAMW